MLKGGTKLPAAVAKRRGKARKKVPAGGAKAPAEESYSSSGEEDYSDSEDEGVEDYKKGGYHPVNVGEKYNNGRYTVLKKLGWGHFSTVWLVHDAETGEYRALKVQKSAQHYTEAARDEITLLTQLRDGDPNNEMKCVRLYDSFDHVGPHGRHVCLVFEVLGDNLLALIKRYDYRGIPIPVVRNLAQQMLVALDYMHRCCDIIHTDFKPENVMLVEPLRDRTWVIPDPSAPQPALEALKLAQPAAATAAAATAAPAASGGSGGAPAASGGGGGLTRNQRKNLRKKMKRAAAKKTDQANGGDDDDGSDVESTSGMTGAQSGDPDAADTAATGGAGAGAGAEAHASGGANGNDNGVAPMENGEAAGGEGDAETAARVASGAEATTTAGAGANQVVITRPGLTDEQLATAACKVVDFGNACWTYKQFTTDVQTRQYRCPEVILGAKYSTPADMWSLACVVFELVTGDLLFDPRSGDKWDRDEDHLALFIELLGRMPRKVYEKGKFCRDYFNRNGELRHIKKLRFWPLDRVLVEKYKLSEEEAASLTSFLTPMLRFVPEERATAAEMLNHPWLRGERSPPQADTDARPDKRSGSAASGGSPASRSASPAEAQQRQQQRQEHGRESERDPEREREREREQEPSRYNPGSRGGGGGGGDRGARRGSRSRSRSRSHEGRRGADARRERGSGGHGGDYERRRERERWEEAERERERELRRRRREQEERERREQEERERKRSHRGKRSRSGSRERRYEREQERRYERERGHRRSASREPVIELVEVDDAVLVTAKAPQ
ncbi:hypothetical protein HYH02_012937 [Chlamydomonas schloesseri]|uniref:non-specific serine/threonine protein kinase n=1 Tax=Chlamydomonas schloesseri TaxID=2026947 RepID=A0A835T204_9CHLO|nr:hypothetical protein HYH02_012937 [Chlamydomonas schloesseri]|eukprot:KAG2432364.1 hypothetical protein HYH02_012937 [Chlamydomonas schloesseri]